LIEKIQKAKIPNEDLSSRTNLRVEFEKKFRRVAFGLSENNKIDHAGDRYNHKFQESMKSNVDNPKLHSRRDIGKWNSEL
jgi:hypothetical protein